MAPAFGRVPARTGAHAAAALLRWLSPGDCSSDPGPGMPGVSRDTAFHDILKQFSSMKMMNNQPFNLIQPCSLMFFSGSTDLPAW